VLFAVGWLLSLTWVWPWSWPVKDWVTFLRWRGPLITNTMLWIVVVIFTSAEECDYALVRSVCLSVSLTVRPITHKLVNGFWRSFLMGKGMTQGPSYTILVAIRITLQFRESKSEIWILRIGGGLFSVNTLLLLMFSYGISDEKCSSQLEGYPICHRLET